MKRADIILWSCSIILIPIIFLLGTRTERESKVDYNRGWSDGYTTAISGIVLSNLYITNMPYVFTEEQTNAIIDIVRKELLDRYTR